MFNATEADLTYETAQHSYATTVMVITELLQKL
jgi:hypothetical protein